MLQITLSNVIKGKTPSWKKIRCNVIADNGATSNIVTNKAIGSSFAGNNMAKRNMVGGYFWGVLVAFLFMGGSAQAGKKLRVLFIGNSYTSVNNLPQIIASVASSMGDTVIYDSNTPGGYSFYSHCTDPATLAKITAGGWDYVVLQDQSESPSYPTAYVEAYLFPKAKFLDSLVDLYSPCGQTMLYMTWAWRDGSDQPVWPPQGTYQGMDSLTNLRYRMMADSNDAELTPVGAVWHYIRLAYPNIELYQSDKSHPSAAGSYAAACSFYSTLFRKDPTLIPYNYSLSALEANNIKAAARLVVYDSLSKWHIGEYDLKADFTATQSAGNQVSFSNISSNAASSKWNFGDGQTSTLASPSHTYTVTGIYNVRLIVSDSANTCSDTMNKIVNLFPAGVDGVDIDNKEFIIGPNPVSGHLIVKAAEAMSYPVQLKISNSLAQTVYTAAPSATATRSIDLSEFATGVYFLTISCERGVIYRTRFVKN